MDGFLAGGHEDLDAHPVGGGWRRHVVSGDGEARDVAACSDFDSAGPVSVDDDGSRQVG
jgi:hypothetical protein